MFSSIVSDCAQDSMILLVSSLNGVKFHDGED